MTVPHLAAVMMMLLLLLPAAVAVARNVVWPTVGPCKVTESQTSKVSECRQQSKREGEGGGERGRCIEIAFACQISSRLSVHDDFHDAATTAAQ